MYIYVTITKILACLIMTLFIHAYVLKIEHKLSQNHQCRLKFGPHCLIVLQNMIWMYFTPLNLIESLECRFENLGACGYTVSSDKPESYEWTKTSMDEAPLKETNDVPSGMECLF